VVGKFDRARRVDDIGGAKPARPNANVEADAVKRRVDDAQLPGAACDCRGDVEVRVERVVANGRDARRPRFAGDRVGRSRGRDVRRDLDVGRRDDLGTGVVVDLVAVVGCGVVAAVTITPAAAAK
jgi:hypothetical protein